MDEDPPTNAPLPFASLDFCLKRNALADNDGEEEKGDDEEEAAGLEFDKVWKRLRLPTALLAAG